MEGPEVKLRLFLTSAMDGGEWHCVRVRDTNDKHPAGERKIGAAHTRRVLW